MGWRKYHRAAATPAILACSGSGGTEGNERLTAMRGEIEPGVGRQCPPS
jgi:hypothetical protein